MSRAWVQCVTLVAALGFARNASAAELGGAQLVVTAEPNARDCPDAERLVERVRSLWMAPETNAAPLHVTLHFARENSGFSAVLQSFGRKNGTRHLSTTGTTCASLADAITVALAVLLDMEPISKPEAADQTERASPPPPAPRNPPARRAARFELAALARAGAGFLVMEDAVSGVFSASLVGRRGPFALEAQAFWVTPLTIDYAPGFVTVGLWGGALDACYQSPPFGAGVRFRPCAGLRLGKLTGQGERFDTNYAVVQPWVAVAASGNLEVALRRSARFVLGLALLAPLNRHEFHVTGRGSAFHTRPLAGVCQVGTEFAIW